MKIAKYVLLGLVGLLVVVVAAAAIFALTFDPNRYRDQIERIAKERTGRTLKLQGPLEVALFPSLGAKVAGVTLSERDGKGEFLSLESARASVKLMPLLRSQVIVDKVHVAGLKAQVIKGKDGRFNFDDLVKGDAGKPAPEPKKAEKGEPAGDGTVKFDIAGLEVERSSITYRDVAANRELQLSELNLSTGRVAEKADGRLQLATRVAGKNPAVDATVTFKGDYRVDLEKKEFAFAKVDGELKGTLDKDAIEAKVAAPRVEIAADKATGEAIVVEFRQKGPTRTAEAKLKLGGVQGSAKALAIPAINADIALGGPDFPRAIKLPITGSARADLEKETASAELATKFDESSINAKLGLAKFAPPAYTFDVNVDKLNLDQYVGEAKPGPAPQAKKDGEKKPAPQAQQDTPVDLSAIKDLNATGRIQFGALQARGLKLAAVKAEIKAANGRMDIAPHSANLYDGSMSGALTLNASGNRVALKETLTNVSVGPLLRDLAQQDRLEGRGNVSLDVTTAGPTVNAMKRGLNGTAKVHLRDGAVKGFDIAGLLRKAKSLGKSDQGSADGKEKTDFSELTASFNIKNGVAHNQDLDLKAPLIRVGGAGNIDIAGSTLDYVAKASVVATSKGQGGRELEQLAGVTVPVKLTGPFDDLKYQVDYGAVAADVAKSRIGQKLEERLGIKKPAAGGEQQGGGSTVDKLRGLFGR